MADVYELAGLSRRLSDRDAAAHGSTAAQWQVLSAVSTDPATVPAIARRLGTVRQAVQRVVGDLIETGVLVAQPNPAHKRSPLITLTADGEQLLGTLWQATTPARAAAVKRADLSEADLLAARETLRKLIDALT
jgi:DNA-binding MarR family transcriptional regulator